MERKPLDTHWDRYNKKDSKNVEKLSLSYTADRSVTQCILEQLWKSLAVPQKITYRVTM